jgi:hypothetical protein
MRGIEVLNNNERKIGGGWERAQQPAAGIKTARGRADADDGRARHYRMVPRGFMSGTSGGAIRTF